MDVKDTIVNLAQDLIQKNGIDSFSFRTLANSVNIKSASVHYHFPKKEDLLVEIAKRYNQNFSQHLEVIDKTKSSPKKKLLSLLGIFDETKKNNKICLCAVFASMSESLGEDSLKEIDVFFNNLSGWILNILKHAKKNDELKSDLALASLTNLIVASFEGALLIDRLKDSNKYLKSCRDLVNSILD